MKKSFDFVMLFAVTVLLGFSYLNSQAQSGRPEIGTRGMVCPTLASMAQSGLTLRPVSANINPNYTDPYLSLCESNECAPYYVALSISSNIETSNLDPSRNFKKIIYNINETEKVK